MKHKKVLWTALPFLAGTIFGISILGLLSFTSEPKSPDPGAAATKISVADAHTYFLNYYKTAKPDTSKMKGFTIGKEELSAMNSVLAAVPSAVGFRVYFGSYVSGTRLSVICGVDAKGSDITGTIYGVTTSKPSPCPPNCDTGSVITGQ
jgi:hypothetical protein